MPYIFFVTSLGLGFSSYRGDFKFIPAPFLLEIRVSPLLSFIMPCKCAFSMYSETERHYSVRIDIVSCEVHSKSITVGN